MYFRPDPPSQHEVLGSAQRYRDAQNEFRAQSDVLRQIAGQIGHTSVWAGVSAEHVSSALGTIADATDGFASASGSVASTLEVLAYAVSPLIAQRQSVIAQLKQQAREAGLSATLVFSKLKGDLIGLESRIQRCFEQASDDVRAAATHAAAWRTDINVNPQAMRQAIGEEIGKSFASFAGGVVDGVWEPVAGTWNLVTHPESVVNLVRAFQADGPGTLKKMWDGIIDAETWQKDPARAMGKIAPGIIATILTAGEGGAALAAGRATGKVERSAATYSEKIATRFPQPETPAFGGPSRGDYRRTFFDANPGIDPSATIVHHAVEQQVSRLYPGLFSRDEINSLFNLRGIPKDINSDLHLSQLRMDWNDFYEMNPNASREQILEYKNKLDKIYGNQFTPKVR